jgi:predicted enzyme related to lactoylglutathione lyase
VVPIMANAVVWFDIPVSDIDRAIKFYEALTGQTLTRLPVGPGEETALFEPGEKGEVSGCLFSSPEDRPSIHGSRVYLNASPNLDAWLARVEPAGGTIARRKTPIPGQGRGVFAYIIDTEGNRVGLHAMA